MIVSATHLFSNIIIMHCYACICTCIYVHLHNIYAYRMYSYSRFLLTFQIKHICDLNINKQRTQNPIPCNSNSIEYFTV